MKNLSLLTICLFVFFSQKSLSQISQEDLSKIIELFHKEYDIELKTQGARLEINPAANEDFIGFWWDLDQVHAAYAGYYDKEENVFNHYLYLLGGYARLPGMTRDGIIATLCHELGHGLGGAPYKVNEFETTQVSVEGQADYFAYRYCVPRMFKQIEPADVIKPVNSYTEYLCQSQTHLPISLCNRMFQSLESERLFFRMNPEDPDTEYDRPDISVATSVNTEPYYYPSSQCRLDTMISGILATDRPRCWYAP